MKKDSDVLRVNGGFPIEIYADGPNINQIKGLASVVTGYTFNPTLFKNLGVKNYLEFCKELVEVCNFPISLEVFADDKNGMVSQAKKLSSLSELVYVKIPISYTNGNSTKDVIDILVSENIKLNITAVFTMDQIQNIIKVASNSEIIISIFSGRIFDIGYDAVSYTKKLADFIHQESNCKVLWASPRMVYDLVNACNACCDIITMNPSLIKKIDIFEKTLEEYSLDTVKMFFNDASSSGYLL